MLQPEFPYVNYWRAAINDNSEDSISYRADMMLYRIQVESINRSEAFASIVESILDYVGLRRVLIYNIGYEEITL